MLLHLIRKSLALLSGSLKVYSDSIPLSAAALWKAFIIISCMTCNTDLYHIMIAPFLSQFHFRLWIIKLHCVYRGSPHHHLLIILKMINNQNALCLHVLKTCSLQWIRVWRKSKKLKAICKVHFHTTNPAGLVWQRIVLRHIVLQGRAVLYWTRSLGALRAPNSSWRPFGPLDFILRALRTLRPVRRARLRSGPVKIGLFFKMGHFFK